ncbi:hypothetical protein [Nocardia cyriacigeorgica]|uniref:hypothetical protein n=1 Tax=Nocardia cyriacigeorgica TaxID=135487 RepID=UPI00245459F9|nr:hypothetical protein [Nocardia cyriacigeorgica]
MRGTDDVVAPLVVCESADVELAHQLMRRHRECRIERCAWKWVAYSTLVRFGRLAPQSTSPRERALLRGLEFPGGREVGQSALRTYTDRCGDSIAMTDIATLRQVLDGLTEKVHDERHQG